MLPPRLLKEVLGSHLTASLSGSNLHEAQREWESFKKARQVPPHLLLREMWTLEQVMGDSWGVPLLLDSTYHCFTSHEQEGGRKRLWPWWVFLSGSIQNSQIIRTSIFTSKYQHAISKLKINVTWDYSLFWNVYHSGLFAPSLLSIPEII